MPANRLLHTSVALTRIGIYCSHCMRFLRHGREDGPGGGGIEWIEMCDWCAERRSEREKELAELERLEQMWAARECAAPDCSVVFTPVQSTQRFHDDRCRKRTQRRLKARRVASERG